MSNKIPKKKQKEEVSELSRQEKGNKELNQYSNLKKE